MDRRKPSVIALSMILAVLLLPGLLPVFRPVPASAASSSELQEVLDYLKDQAQQAEAQSGALSQQLAENTSETQDAIERKSNIDRRMELTRLQIDNLNSQIQQYDLLIAARQEELEQARSEEKRLNEQYKLRIRSMEEGGGISYLAILFDSSSFTDLLSSLDMIAEIAESDQKMLDQLCGAAEAIQMAAAAIEADRAALEDTKAQLTELKTQLAGQRAEADAAIAELAARGGDLKSQFDTYLSMQDWARQQIFDVQQQYEEALAEEGAAGEDFLFPLPEGSAYVSQAYGCREDPIYGYYAMHYGVDLSAGRGTPVYASKSGTVTIADYSEANGNFVSINHNDGSASTYAHMTNYTVSAGQTVSRGEVIGYVGDSGWATEPHLHFEIMLDGENVNPMNCVCD